MTADMPATIVDFIENFFGASAADVQQSVVRSPASVIGRRDEFLGLLMEQNVYRPPPPLASGELRPIVAHSVADLASGAVTLGLDEPVADAYGYSLDVRSLLLYAHSVILPTPFGALPTLRGEPAQVQVRRGRVIDNASFLYAVELLCRISELIRAGVVSVVDPPGNAVGPRTDDLEEALNALVPKVAIDLATTGALRSTDQTDLWFRAQRLAERFLRQDAVLIEMTQAYATRLLSCEAERVALRNLTSLSLAGADARAPLILDELIRLQLQAAGRIRMADMVAIRRDASFTAFRDDLAAAVGASAGEGETSQLHDRRAIVAREMQAATMRLKHATNRSTFLSNALGDSFGWIVGSAVGGTIAGWKGAFAGIAARGGAGVVAAIPSRSERAMRTHYVELSRAPEASPAKSGRRRLVERDRGRP